MKTLLEFINTGKLVNSQTYEIWKYKSPYINEYVVKINSYDDFVSLIIDNPYFDNNFDSTADKQNYKKQVKEIFDKKHIICAKPYVDGYSTTSGYDEQNKFSIKEFSTDTNFKKLYEAVVEEVTIDEFNYEFWGKKKWLN